MLIPLIVDIRRGGGFVGFRPELIVKDIFLELKATHHPHISDPIEVVVPIGMQLLARNRRDEVKVSRGGRSSRRWRRRIRVVVFRVSRHLEKPKNKF
jgi:hypothetical protein